MYLGSHEHLSNIKLLRILIFVCIYICLYWCYDWLNLALLNAIYGSARLDFTCDHLTPIFGPFILSDDGQILGRNISCMCQLGLSTMNV